MPRKRPTFKPRKCIKCLKFWTPTATNQHICPKRKGAVEKAPGVCEICGIRPARMKLCRSKLCRQINHDHLVQLKKGEEPTWASELSFCRKCGKVYIIKGTGVIENGWCSDECRPRKTKKNERVSIKFPPKRFIDCAQYEVCLDDAAMGRKKLACEGCAEYRKKIKVYNPVRTRSDFTGEHGFGR